MTDRFKFRVWDKENEVWVDEEDCSIAPNGELTVLGLDSYGETNFRETDDCIVEQCTGLKDKNEKLIYENDLLKDNNGIWQVKWNNEEGAFYIWNKKRDFYLSPFIGKYEIIGNINENPELLEEKAE